MKLLKNIKLPKGFDIGEGYHVDVDENPELIYESYIFTTILSFEAAISALDLLLSNHYGPLKKPAVN